MISFHRKLTALLVAVAVFLGVVPVALAQNMVPHPTAAMALMAAKSDMGPCSKTMPASERPNPCKNDNACSGMLGCCVSAALPSSGATMSPAYVVTEAIASLQINPAGVSLQPAHPPPIL